MPNLPRSELQSADPSFSYICAGTDGPCTTIDWRHRVEPINPTPNDGWKSSVWISNSSILTWSSQICQAPTDGLLWLCWSWLARSSSPSQPETWESDAFTVVLHSYIEYDFSDHVMNHVGSLWNPWFWYDLPPLILWFIMIYGSLTSLGWLTRGDGPGESLGSGRCHWVHHGLVLQRLEDILAFAFFAIFIPRNLTTLPGAQVHFARNCLCPGSLKLSTSLTSWLFNFHHLFICKTCAADFSEFSRQAHPGIWSVDLRPVLHSLWHLKRCEEMWRHMTQAWTCFRLHHHARLPCASFPLKGENYGWVASKKKIEKTRPCVMDCRYLLAILLTWRFFELKSSL